MPLPRNKNKESSLIELHRKESFLADSMTSVRNSDISISEDGQMSYSGRRDMDKCFIRAQPQLPDLEERSAKSAYKQLHQLSQQLADADELSYTQIDRATWMPAEEFIRQRPKMGLPENVEVDDAEVSKHRLTTNSNCVENFATNCSELAKTDETDEAATNQAIIDEAKLAENIVLAAMKQTEKVLEHKLKSCLEWNELESSLLQEETRIGDKKPSEGTEQTKHVEGIENQTNDILKMPQHAICQIDDWNALTLLLVLSITFFMVYSAMM